MVLYFNSNVKYSKLAELIVNTGGLGALVELIATAKFARVPGIMTIGYIAGHSDLLALAVIKAQVRLQTE